MKKCNLNGFDMPIVVKNDSEYFSELSKILETYISFLENGILENEILENEIRNINDKIIRAVKNYYDGNILESIKEIKEVLQNYEKDACDFFVSELDKSYAFRGVAPFKELFAKSEDGDTEYKKMNENNLSFFRARLGNVDKKEDMLHISLKKRGVVGTQRFSVPGIPCIYLGTTSYCCWLELGKPRNYDFNVSSFLFNEEGKKLKILNLVISQHIINGLTGKKISMLQKKVLKLLPLVMATSFTVLEKDRKFKSEYIVSQLIMLCLKDLQIDGVAYLSKKGKNDFQYPHGVNLAIPVFDTNDDKEYGKVCNCFALTEPINYEEFLNLKIMDLKEESYVNKIYKEKTVQGIDDFMSKINYNGKSIFYGKLKFSELDNYLVSMNHKIVN